MAITFQQVQELLKKEQINFYIAPERPIARFRIAGLFGRYDIVVLLQDDGGFLQLRTVEYFNCSAAHPYLKEILTVLATVNFQKRLVKYAWDAKDGEIVAYADAWIMDNQLTQLQFNRMMGNFIPSIDTSHPRIKATMETGKDPGEPDSQAALAKVTGGGSPPPPPPAEPPKTPDDKPEIKEI